MGKVNLCTVEKHQVLMNTVAATSEHDLMFIVSNCQSYRANAKNMNDPITNHSKISLLKETWLQNNEDVPTIENFKLVSRDNPKRAGGVAIFIRNDQNFHTYVPAAVQSMTHSITGDSCIFNYEINILKILIHFICEHIKDLIIALMMSNIISKSNTRSALSTCIKCMRFFKSQSRGTTHFSQ